MGFDFFGVFLRSSKDFFLSSFVDFIVPHVVFDVCCHMCVVVHGGLWVESVLVCNWAVILCAFCR